MTEFLLQYWAEITLGLMVLDKIVAKTKCKWDDLIFTAIKEVIFKVTGKKAK